jgi:acyl carrier protein
MNVCDKVIEILHDLTSSTEISPNSLLKDDLDLDSLGMVMLLVSIAENFEIELDESDMVLSKLIYVQDVVDLVTKHKGDSNE